MNTFDTNISQITIKQSDIFSKQLGFNTRFRNSNIIIKTLLTPEQFENNKKQIRFLRQFKHANIEFLKLIKSYRGIRHRKLLPVRGQRTHTNAKTNRKKHK